MYKLKDKLKEIISIGLEFWSLGAKQSVQPLFSYAVAKLYVWQVTFQLPDISFIDKYYENSLIKGKINKKAERVKRNCQREDRLVLK